MGLAHAKANESSTVFSETFFFPKTIFVKRYAGAGCYQMLIIIVHYSRNQIFTV